MSKALALQLGMSPYTVNEYAEAVMRKLRLIGRTGAEAVVLRWGLLDG